MARPKRTSPDFISFNVRDLFKIAKSMNVTEWGEWSLKALTDILASCVGDDVDPVVKEVFNHSLERMVSTQERRSKEYQVQKNKASSSSTEVVPVNGSKRNDQLIWGRFENVYLSQEEYNTLLQDFGNINLLNQVIEAFSSSLADGNTSSNNHFASLTRWIATRKRWDEESKQGKETFAEREGKRQVEQLKKFGLIK